MAIYSNFEGTFKSKIQIGKKGPLLVNDGGVFSVTDTADTPVVMKVGTPTADDHSSTKKYVDDKFGTADDQVRTNVESDALYEALARKNTANGYVGLGTDGKIEAQYMPSLSIVDIHTVDNFEDRNMQVVQKGDMAIVTSIQVWQHSTEYAKETLIKFETADVGNFPSGFKFWVCDKDHTSGTTTIDDDIAAHADWWLNSTWEDTGNDQTWETGDEQLFENIMYVCTEDKVTDKSPKDEGKFRLDDKRDGGLYIMRQEPTPDGDFNSKDDDWSVVDFGAQVATFKGRTGIVNPETGDYNAAQVINVPAGDITATTVQTALNELNNQRVKRTGDVMSGPLTTSQGTEAEPAIRVPGSVNSGLFQGTSAAPAISYNGTEKIRFGANIYASTALSMQDNRIQRVSSPVDAGDAVNKEYVDAIPTISKSAHEPDPADGTEGNVHLTTLAGGLIKMHKAEQWFDIVASGDRYIAVSRGATNPIASTSTSGGIAWAGVQMPPAPTSTTKYKQIVSNGSGNFLAIRDHINPASDNNRLVYTQDGGHTWPKVSQAAFGTAGEFIAADLEADSTPYLVAGKGTNKAFTSVRGEIWTPVTLPASAAWSCSAGAMRNYVILAGDPAGKNVCVYTNDQGSTWNTSTLPASIFWKSVYTTDGVNYVAVGYGTTGTGNNTTTGAYSHDGGANWSLSTLPSNGQWSSTISNGGAYIAIRNMAKNAAMSLDAGETWSEIMLPSASGWGKLASDGRTFVALNTNTSTISPIAVSKDGGNTWFTEVDGQISAIHVREDDEWLKFESLQAGASDFVRRTGSRMTGSLVIDNGRGRASLTASGAIKAQGINATMQLMSNSTIKDGGAISIGADNSDAVMTNKIYQWQLATRGSYTGYNLHLRAKTRGTTDPIDMVTINSESISSDLPVSLNIVKNVKSRLAIAPVSSRFGMSIDDLPNIGRELIALGTASTSATKDAISLRSGTTKLLAETSPTGKIVFRVRCDGTVETKLVKATKLVAMSNTSDELTGVEVQHFSMPVDQAGIRSFYVNSRQHSELHDNHSHFLAQERSYTVFNVGSKEMFVRKPVVFDASSYGGSVDLDIKGHGAIKVPVGTTVQRPTITENGMIRYNTDTAQYEVWENIAWVKMITGGTSFTGNWEIANWSTGSYNGNTHYYTIPVSKHGQGVFVTCDFQAKIGTSTNYINQLFDYIISANGDVKVWAYFPETTDIVDVRYRVRGA